MMTLGRDVQTTQRESRATQLDDYSSGSLVGNTQFRPKEGLEERIIRGDHRAPEVRELARFGGSGRKVVSLLLLDFSVGAPEIWSENISKV